MASAHNSCVGVDVAIVEVHNAAVNVDTSALPNRTEAAAESKNQARIKQEPGQTQSEAVALVTNPNK